MTKINALEVIARALCVDDDVDPDAVDYDRTGAARPNWHCVQGTADAILTALEAKGLVIEQGWQPIETAPPYTGEVELYREDAGVFWGERTTLEQSGYITESEIESGHYSDEALEALDWWYWGPNGPVRLEGAEVPTHWRLPEPPAMLSAHEDGK